MTTEATDTPKKRGRPKGSKNKTTAIVQEAKTNGGANGAKRGRKKKTTDVFDPSQLTFDQVILTVKYAQDKIGDLSILQP